MKKIIKSFLLSLKALVGKELSVRPEIKVNKEFIGDQYAGWTICPDELNSKSIIYAFGIGENISFDLGMIKRFNCDVFAFDPTPKSIKWLNNQDTPNNFKSFDYGIADHDGTITFHAPANPDHISHTMLDRKLDSECIDVQVRELSTILKELGHNKIDILKMDIEGAEYSVIDNLIQNEIEISQILVEFHHRFDQIDISKSQLAIKNLQSSGYKLFDVSSSREEYSFIKS